MMRALALACLLLNATLRGALPASDAFGYSATSIPYGWTDISGTGTPILNSDWAPNADDGAVQVDLPFNFRFYGSTYAKLYLSSNGYIQFGSSSSFYAPNCLDLNVAPLNIAAAYWMDLDPSKPGGSVHKEVLGSAPNRSMVLQFTTVQPRLGAGSVTFQIVIDEDNGLRFFYVSTSTHDGGASAVSGLRAAFDCPNRQGLPVTCQQAVLGDGSAVRFSYPGAEPACGTPTVTWTFSVSPTRTQSSTRTFTPTISPTFSHSPTATPSPSDTATPTITETFSHTATASPSGTISPTFSASPTFTATPSETPTRTASATETLSHTASPTSTETGSATETPSVTLSFSASPTATETPSITETSTPTPSSTETPTASATPTLTDSATLTASPSVTPSSTASPSATVTPSRTHSGTYTETPTSSITSTLTASASSTPTPTFTCTLLPAAIKPACLVVGQGSFSSNANAPAGPTTLNGPLAVALDTRLTPYRLYVADTLNHRVVYWNDASTITFGSTPDGVLGQPDLNSFAPNNGGISATSLNAPAGLAVDPVTGALWVADTGNHRLLRFSLPLSATGSAADRVLGQSGSFSTNTPNSGGLSAASFSSPSGLSTDAFGNLAIADTGNHRVLRISNPGANSAADASWGQGGSYASGISNLGGVSAQSLNAPTGVLLLPDRLWVADTGNHRVLQYDLSLPIVQGARILLGQAGPTLNAANRGFGLTNDDRFSSPSSVAVDYSGRLYVGDKGNHRVIAFEPPYAGPAQLVYGQPNMGLNSVGCTNDKMNQPVGLAASGATLAVADSGNHRVLAYGCSAGLQASTSTPTFTPTSTKTPTSTISATHTFSPTRTSSFSPSPSFSASPTITLSSTRTITLTLTFSNTVTPTFSISTTRTTTPTPSITVTALPSQTLPPTATPYPHVSDQLLPYPNPVAPEDARACFAFPAAPGASVQLFDQLGQPVATLDGTQIQAPQGFACWDLRAVDGTRAAPGLYFVRVVANGQAHLAKFTLR